MPSQAVLDTPDRESIRDQNRGDKFVRNLFFANVPLPFQKLRTYLWLVVFSRAFGPTGFGIWSLFQTTLSSTLMFTGMTQGNAMLRFLPANRTQEETNRAFSSVMAAVAVSSAIAALGFIIFSKGLSNLIFRDYRGRTALIVIAATVPFETWFEMMRGLLRGCRLNRSWAFFTLGRQAPEMLILMALAWWWIRDPLVTIGGYFATAALSVLLGFFYLVRRQHVRLVRPSTAILAKYLPYGLALVPAALASALSFAADRYLVGYYLDLRQVGIYSVCFTVSALGFFFVGPLNDVLLPEMSALHDAQEWDLFYIRFSQVQKFVTGLALGAMALLVAFPQQVLRALTTRDFSSGASTLAVLGLQGIFMSLVMLYATMLLVRLRVWWTSAIWASMGLIILITDVILLPRVGIIGAGVSQLISSIAGAALVVGLNWDLFRRTFRFHWIAQGGLALSVVWLLAHFWRGDPSSFGDSLLHLAAGAIVFVLVLGATGYVRISELVALRKALLRTPA